ncbi:type II toxin-antitoxin system death-on-curing family toxin [Gloeocapsa sp. PCC 73106]|uniref:type II toxin-antitoxin system death-on-curing family toxin n=1 Tax=Gloeocapsa sp. PCC 73106 TaxID=102232 RepID=UPI0002AC8AD9|nr:type II toxin-antitoxin system death-on-curing family toxin [Gloeocapsa sp. PCC 73106]ELR97773.1 death-on-curing family protein [Gloeocapsa sp. PCC 73106]
MNQYLWISEAQARAIHRQQLDLFGGAPGILDAGKLSSALARPRHIYTYNPSFNIYQLAAAYAWGLVRNHPFVDGNKRCAFVIMAVFLKVNGIDLILREAEVVTTMLALASGEMSEEELAAWLQKS